MDIILAIKWDHLVAIIVGNVSLFSFDPYLVVSNKIKSYTDGSDSQFFPIFGSKTWLPRNYSF